MANYNYTHGTTTDKNRLRLIIGDHRGTNGTSGADWLFSDEELTDILTLCPNNLINAAALCMQVRMNREAMAAGVTGTTDTTDRPAAIANAIRSMERIDLPDETTSVQSETHSLDDLADNEDRF